MLQGRAGERTSTFGSANGWTRAVLLRRCGRGRGSGSGSWGVCRNTGSMARLTAGMDVVSMVA